MGRTRGDCILVREARLASSFEIDLLLLGFASATCSVLFASAPGRRFFMGVALACAVAIVVIHLMGLYRILMLASLAYLVRQWWLDRRGARESPGSARAATETAAPPREGA